MERNRLDATPRRTHRRVALTLALAALLLAPALALADGPGRPGLGRDGGLPLGEGAFGPDFFGAGAEGEAGGPPPFRRLAFFLDLTEAQVGQAQAIFEAARAEAQPLREQRRALLEQLRAALDAAEPDAAAVGALVIDLDANRQALRAVHEGALDDFEAILTPEQLERFEVLRDARRVFGRHGRHGRGPRRHLGVAAGGDDAPVPAEAG